MIFWKSAKGGGRSFSIQKFILQILGTLNRFFYHEIDTKEKFQGSGYVIFNNCINYKGWGLIASLEQLVDLSANEKPPFVL